MATVGGLKRQGKNGLHIRCAGCGYIVITWWQSLGVPDDRQLEAVIRQLRCDRSGRGRGRWMRGRISKAKSCLPGIGER